MLEPDPENKGSPGRASSSFQSGLGQPLTNPVAGSSKSSQPIASSSSLPSRPGNVGIVDDQSSRAASPSNFIRGFQVNSPTTEIGREGETSRNDSPSNVTRRTRKQKRHQSNLDINNNPEDSDSESDTGSVQEEKFELWPIKRPRGPWPKRNYVEAGVATVILIEAPTLSLPHVEIVEKWPDQLSRRRKMLKACSLYGTLKLHKLKGLQRHQVEGLYAKEVDMWDKACRHVFALQNLEHEIGYQMDEDKYGVLLRRLRKRLDLARPSLEEYHIFDLEVPVWGPTGQVDVWVGQEDYEFYTVEWLAKIEHFLATLALYHDWETGTLRPKETDDLDRIESKTPIKQSRIIDPTVEDRSKKATRFAEGERTDEPSRRLSSLHELREQTLSERSRASSRPGYTRPSQFSTRGEEVYGERLPPVPNRDPRLSHSYGHLEQEKMSASSYQNQRVNTMPLQAPAPNPDPGDDGDDDPNDDPRGRPHSDRPRDPSQNRPPPPGGNRYSNPGATIPPPDIRMANSSEPHFDQKLKLSDIETWDGNTDTLATWLIKLDDLATWSAKVRIQLGKLVPKRLTGSADRWYWSLPVSYRRNVETDWETLRQAFASYYMTRKWWEKQRKKARNAAYRDYGHTRETPSEYYIRKSELLNLAFTLSDSEIITEVMEGAPDIWSSVLDTQRYADTIEFQASIKYHEETLMNLSQGRNFRYSNFQPFNQRNDVPERSARVNLVGWSSKLPPPQYPKDDSNVTKKGLTPKQKGARPCRHCGSDLHWDPECKYHKKGMREARTRLANTDMEYLEAQDEYEDLYYGLDQTEDLSDSDREEPSSDFSQSLQTTEDSNSPEISALEGGSYSEKHDSQSTRDSPTSVEAGSFRIESSNNPPSIDNSHLMGNRKF